MIQSRILERVLGFLFLASDVNNVKSEEEVIDQNETYIFFTTKCLRSMYIANKPKSLCIRSLRYFYYLISSERIRLKFETEIDHQGKLINKIDITANKPCVKTSLKTNTHKLYIRS